MRKSPEKTLHDELMAKVPPGAVTVLVKTAGGDQKYRLLAEVADTDEIQTNKSGTPIIMKAAPGRRKVPVLQPANDLVKEILKRKRDILEDDPVFKATKFDSESSDVLKQVMLALSEEAACIRFDRLEAERNGKATGQHSLHRINALKALVDTFLKRREQLGVKDIDLKSPAIGQLIKVLLDTFREAMVSTGEREEMIKTVFAKASQMMKDEMWENDLRNRMKNAL